MSKTELRQEKNDEFLDKIKGNYVQRIQEFGNFSKHLLNSCVDMNAEFLNGLANIVQKSIDLQKKYLDRFPKFYDEVYLINQAKLVNEAWIQAIKNLDSFYNEFLKYGKNNLGFMDKNIIEFIRNAERFYDLYEDMQSAKIP
jgi:hypothetical protein